MAPVIPASEKSSSIKSLRESLTADKRPTANNISTEVFLKSILSSGCLNYSFKQPDTWVLMLEHIQVTKESRKNI